MKNSFASAPNREYSVATSYFNYLNYNPYNFREDIMNTNMKDWNNIINFIIHTIIRLIPTNI